MEARVNIFQKSIIYIEFFTLFSISQVLQSFLYYQSPGP